MTIYMSYDRCSTGRAVVLRAVHYFLIGTKALALPLPFPAEDKYDD
jgi:hypothetical protein